MVECLGCRNVFLSLFFCLSSFLIFGFLVWQSETYKNGGFINDDTVWYSVTLVIHYPDEAKVVKKNPYMPCSRC